MNGALLKELFWSFKFVQQFWTELSIEHFQMLLFVVAINVTDVIHT